MNGRSAPSEIVASHHSKSPNIILIVLDAVRARNVSAYGYLQETTPFLDEFAAGNLLFNRAISPATWTIPTHASLLSGLYLSQHRLETLKGDRRFNPHIRTLPDLLSENGYQTAAFSQNILFSGQHYLADGFREFYHLEDFLNLPRRKAQNQRKRRMFGADGAVTGYLRKLRGPRLLFDKMTRWLNALDDETPAFLMTNITNAHYPWAPPLDLLLPKLGSDIGNVCKRDFVTLDPFRFNSGISQVTDTHRRMWLAFYDAAIMHVDREVGRFLRRLSRWEGWSNTIVIITADHGELLGDYRDIVGHTLSVTDKLIHVPLMIRHPDYLGGISVEGVVQTLDLLASIVHWLGLEPQNIAPAQLQRPPLANAVANAADHGGIAFAEEDYTDGYDVIGGLQRVNPEMDAYKYPRQQIAVRSATHKYIWFDDRPGEFYDLLTGPAEEHNILDSGIAAQLPSLLSLQDALASWRSNLELLHAWDVPDVYQMDTDVRARLRELGYVH